jgi:hypothetical protein
VEGGDEAGVCLSGQPWLLDSRSSPFLWVVAWSTAREVTFRASASAARTNCAIATGENPIQSNSTRPSRMINGL